MRTENKSQNDYTDYHFPDWKEEEEITSSVNDYIKKTEKFKESVSEAIQIANRYQKLIEKGKRTQRMMPLILIAFFIFIFCLCCLVSQFQFLAIN